ncbi:hypothetical protein SUGI_0580440 [Cryptomeria japonica]|nr:hypothetical protein SUGI_0580440 [Cryptomeria japonica]
MSSPGDWFNSLTSVSKAYGTLCLMTTAGYHMGLVNPKFLYLDYDLVVKHLQIWRLLTNFFFLGPFSINFAIRLLIIARCGVHLERGPFERRTGDFLWMMIFGALSLLGFSLVLALNSYYMGRSLVFMLPYIWAREFPNAQVNISGLVTLKGFYLPWAMLAMNVIFGSPLIPDLLGIVVGHLYYFLTAILVLGKEYIEDSNLDTQVSCTLESGVFCAYENPDAFLQSSSNVGSVLHNDLGSKRSRHPLEYWLKPSVGDIDVVIAVTAVATGLSTIRINALYGEQLIVAQKGAIAKVGDGECPVFEDNVAAGATILSTCNILADTRCTSVISPLFLSMSTMRPS